MVSGGSIPPLQLILNRVIMKQQNFKTKDGKNHMIDKAGNHFINGKCVNPKATSKLEIGDTYPPLSERIYKVTK